MGSGILQGLGQFLHAVSRHRHRHRRPAGAVPDHPFRRQGNVDVSGDRGACLGGACLYLRRFRLPQQGHRDLARQRADVASRNGGGAGGDLRGVPVRLSQPQPMARPFQLRRAGLDPRTGADRRRRHRRSGGRRRHRQAVLRRHRADRARPDHLPRHTRLRPRHHAGAQLGHGAVVAMRVVDGDHRHARQRHRPAGAGRRADPDHPADRLHRHAACLCRRRAASGPVLRPRAAGAGRRRIGRHGVGLGRAARPRRHQARCQHPARPGAQQPRRCGAQLAAGAACRRPRHLPHDARRGAGTPARPGVAELPPARRRRPLSLVFAARAPGDRIGRRGHPLRRHHGRRDRAEEIRRAAAARRRARQSDRPAEPRTVHEPAGSDHLDRPDRREGAPDRLRHRHRPLQAGQ